MENKMKRHIPGKRWIALAVFALLIAYQKYNENELAKPENICARNLPEEIQVTKSFVPEFSPYVGDTEDNYNHSLLKSCAPEIKSIMYLHLKDSSLSMIFQGTYKNNPNFNVNLCRKNSDCKLIRFIESSDFRSWLGDTLNHNFSLTIGGLQDRKGTEFTWKNSKVVTREVALGKFKPMNLDILKNTKREVSVVDFGEESTENEIFRSLWHEFEPYFPNHFVQSHLAARLPQWTPKSDGTEIRIRQIKVVSPEDTIYEPNDPNFIKVRNRIVEQMCEKIGRFDLIFLPHKRINLGLQMYVSEKSCLEKPHQFVTTLYYPRFNDYPGGLIDDEWKIK
jgi:hypothetical protein